MIWPWITDLKVLGHTGVDHKHKACFGSEGARDAYFLGKALASPANLDSYTQLNTEREIMVEGSYEDLLAADMVTWVNRNLGDKRIYARIIEKRWVNTNCTALSVEIDAYTSFMFDISVESCYVKREMQSGDWAGGKPSFVNTTPEPFACDRHTCVNEEFNGHGGVPHIVVAVTTEPDGTTPVSGSMIGNVYTGCKYRATPSAGQADSIIGEYASEGHLDSIAAVFMAPFNPNQAGDSATISAPGIPTSCDGYRPQNAKLLTYPYTYLEVSTLNGASVQFDYGLFDNPNNPQFEVTAIGVPVPGLIYAPKNYRGIAVDYANAIYLDSNVQCTWSGNAFANWVNSHGVSNVLKIAGAGIGVGLAAMTAGASLPLTLALAGGGAALSGISTGAAQAARPSEARGIGSGDSAAYALNKFGVWFKAMTPTAAIARRIDGAFNGLGYATDTVKTPNIRSRPYYNYVQTLNASVSGNITASWIDQIEDMLNSGVTFWHVDQGAQIGNYNVSNGG